MKEMTFWQKLKSKGQALAKRLWSWLKRKWRRYQLMRWIIVTFLSLLLMATIYLVFVAKTTNVKALNSELKQATEIYDASNQKAGYLYSQKGTWVDLDKISPNMQNAVLSTEDRNFYHEHGFSVKGIARAFYLLGKNKLLHRDYYSGGGSTLSQQLVKNTFLSQKQTFSRKAKEIFISVQVENVYSKKQILTMYLNDAYFGNGVWGVQDAARKYFGVNADQLTIPQAATLAGMLKGPNLYNPIQHPKAAKDRRNVVLEAMAENNKISAQTCHHLQQTAMITADDYHYQSGYKYPYFFDAVINEAINKYGLTESDIMNHGYKIYTTLNQKYQQSMQDDFANNQLFPGAAPGSRAKAQAASIALNPKTGGVCALVGGRESTHIFRGYNRATQLVASPGSTIKPLAVYTPALEAGYHYNSMIPDKLQSYGSNHYRPHNWNNVYSGKLPMYEALALSKNTCAVWLLNKIGVQKGFDSAKNFGLPLSDSDDNLSLALGGLKKGVSPLQMATAYAAFANAGRQYPAHFIRKIVDSQGNVIIDNSQLTPKRIISAKTAETMTSMMLDVYRPGGTGASASPNDFTIAGKTGTTAGHLDNQQVSKDCWYIGYTPDLVVANWMGYDSNRYNLNSTGAHQAALFFKQEMEQLLPNTKQTPFNVKPADVLANQDAKSANNSKFSQVWNDLKEKGENLEDHLGSKVSTFLQKGKETLAGWLNH